MNTNLRGIVFILVSGIFLSSNDAVLKSLVAHYPPGQILFITGTTVALVTWLILKLHGGTGVVVNNRLAHLVRGLLFVIASFAFVVSLRHMPLAEVICIAFAGPLFMTVMAKLFLHEEVGLFRIAAVLVGFVGVIIIIQPGGASFRWILLLPLVVALGDAGRDVLTRKMAPTESSLSIVFTTSAVLATVSIFTWYTGWNDIQLQHAWRFAFATLLTVVSYFCMVEAYRHAPAVVIAPFRYIQIIWGILAGLLIWGEVPRASVYIGVFFTVGAGIYIAYRETRYIRRKPTGSLQDS
jgi:drug/metabolite transporter (DMT)-like permease